MARSTRFWPILLVFPMLSGCLYTNIHAPHAYRSATPSDVAASTSDPVVTGESCTHSILFLVAWGDGGYAAATRNALGDRQDSILYDVRGDIRVRSFLLGLYLKSCTVLTGRVGKARP